MADATSSKTMDKKNVVYPDGGGHAKLGVWSSLKGNLARQLGPLLEGDIDGIVTREADDLVRKAIAAKADKDTYFKIGLIGTSLVLRVKTERTGLAAILGYEQKDALLLKNCTRKQAAAAAKTELMTFPTYLAVAPGDLKPIATQYLKFEGGKISLSLAVAGADKDAGLRKRVDEVHETLCKDYRAKARKITDDAADRLAGLSVKSKTTLEAVGAEANAALTKLLDAPAIEKDFEARVRAMAAKDSNLKQHVTEWKIKAACEAIKTSVSLATSMVRVVGSHGADVAAWRGIVSCGYAIHGLINDIRKTETEAAAELEKAIALYTASADSLLKEVEKTYAENRLTSNSVLSVLKTAGAAATLARDKITRAIKSTTGKDVMQEPEAVRLRYLVELGKLLNALDAQVVLLNRKMDEFKASSISEAVKAWPKLQGLKKTCDVASRLFHDREAYARDAKVRIALLNIAVDDSTSLDKLKKMIEGVRTVNAGMVLQGLGPLATIAQAANSACSAVEALTSAVAKYA